MTYDNNEEFFEYRTIEYYKSKNIKIFDII
jgi:hypothetical protein